MKTIPTGYTGMILRSGALEYRGQLEQGITLNQELLIRLDKIDNSIYINGRVKTLQRKTIINYLLETISPYKIKQRKNKRIIERHEKHLIDESIDFDGLEIIL